MGGFIDRLRGRWWVVLIAIGVCVGIAGLYLAIATPIYTVTAIVMAERTRPVTRTDLPPDEFLALQKGAILTAARRAGVSDLDVRTDKGEGTITISTESAKPQQAALALSTVTNAYLKEANAQQASMLQKLTDLAAERDRLAAERAEKDKALADFKKQSNLSGTAADSVVNARRDQLANALAAAQKDAAAAKAAVDVAANLPSDPQQLALVIDAARRAGAFSALDDNRAKTQDQINQLEADLAKQKQTLLPQHPLILQTQRKIDLLKEHLADIQKQYASAYRSYCAQQLATANNKVSELQTLLDQQTQRATSAAGAAQKLTQLEADLKKADDAVAEADKQIREATLSVDSGVRMKLIQPPTAPDRPSRPKRAPILIAAAALGLLAGLVIAIAPRSNRPTVFP